MKKCTPNQQIKLANTLCLFFHWSNYVKNIMNIIEKNDKSWLHKSLFNDRMYPQSTQILS